MNRKEEIINQSKIAFPIPTEFDDEDSFILKGLREVFVSTSEWADQTMIDRACEYLASNMRCDGYTTQTKAKFIQSFREAMKN